MYTTLRVLLGICVSLPLCVWAGEEDVRVYQNSFDQTVPGLERTQGMVGRAARFNGTEDFLSVGELGDHKQVTIAFWVKPDAKQNAAGEDNHGLVTSNAWQRGVMHLGYQAGRVQCYVHLGGARRAHVASRVLPTRKWTHVALVADVQAGRLAMYINGLLQSTDKRAGTLDAIRLTKQVIGAEHVDTKKRFFAGAIDEVNIYSCVLSDQQILALCPTAPRPPKDPRDLVYGKIVPDEGYCDQPYVVVMPNGNWVVTLTTGEGHEGSARQHVVAARSSDQGATWSELIDIEPASEHKAASWVTPLLTPYGRIYAFYTYNTDGVNTLPSGKPFRDDVFGDYCYRYSDDEGRTWSKRHILPMRITACDRDNEWAGQQSRVHFWGISKPQIDGHDVFLTFTKLRRYFLNDGEGWLFHSDTILTERDPDKIRWTMLPEGEDGIRNPDYLSDTTRWPYRSVQEEHNVVALNDGKSLYCVYRTILGFPAQSYSRDRGRTWEIPSPMVFTPGGRSVKHPTACPKLWKCENGKYLFWYHNTARMISPSSPFRNRNPAWILGGIERDGVIHWSEPEILLFDDDPRTVFSYPDLIEQDGKYWVTETNKTIARVHQIDPTLLEGLWAQGSAKSLVTKGLVLNTSDDQLIRGEIDLPEMGFDVYENEGISIDFWYQAPKQWKANEVLLDSRFETADDGPGILVMTNPDRAVTVTLGDGQTRVSWDSDAGLLTPGLHHLVATLDANPKIGSCVVDGSVCDGGKQRKYGWKRFTAVPGDVRGSGVLKVSTDIPSVRIYRRYLRSSEAVSNFNRDKPLRLKKAAAASGAARRNPTFPIYHYMAPSGTWMGDVNGPIYHDGWFHLFYQWRAPDVPGIGWGHARSRDLVDWEHLPLAIPPRGPRGSWSGGTLVTNAGPRILFTNNFQQSGSVGSEDLLRWVPMKKEPAMPKTLHTAKGVEIGGWRDPFLWQHAGNYYACVGGSSGGRGYVSLYRAQGEELDEWEFLGPLFIHPDSPDNACPNFFKVGDKWVLLMSRHRPHVEDWFVGSWDRETLQFKPETSGVLGYNEATYATAGLYHPDGRVVYWNTIHQWRRRNVPTDWPACLSVPRELSISQDNRLLIKPLKELTRLRGKHFHQEGITLNDAGKVLPSVKGDALEIRVTFEPHDAESFGITVRRSDDGTRGMVLRYRDTLYVDGEEGMYSDKHGKQHDPVRKAFVLRDGEPLELIIYIDKASFEAFANKRRCYDRLIHSCDHTGKALALPRLEDMGIEIFAEGGRVTVTSIDVWGMKPIKKTTYQP